MGDWYNQEHRTFARFSKGSITPILHLTINRQAQSQIYFDVKVVKRIKLVKIEHRETHLPSSSGRIHTKMGVKQGCEIYLRYMRLKLLI